MSLRPPAHPSRAQRESAASCRQSLPLHLGCPAFARSVANFEIRSVGVRNSSTKGAAMILVTGAAGNNGQAAVRELSRQSVKVRALVRDASKATVISDLANVEVVQGDMQKPETLSGALDGVERALLISSATPAMYDTQCTFIDAARAAGVRHVVKFSGKESSIGFNPHNFSFTRMHAQVEHHLEASGLDWTHIRPSQFMQVYLREAPSIASKGVLSLAAGDIDLSPIRSEERRVGKE